MEISRIHHCKKCEDYRRPKVDDVFAVKGGTSGILMVKRARIYEGCVKGMTPHLIIMKKVIDDNVVYESVCSIIGCGMSLSQNENGDYDVVVEERYKHVISIKDWNALQTFTNTDYEI